LSVFLDICGIMPHKVSWWWGDEDPCHGNLYQSGNFKDWSPFIYLLVQLVLIIDGGLGLIKVCTVRFLKIYIFQKYDRAHSWSCEKADLAV
jgi:hypothetical protein